MRLYTEEEMIADVCSAIESMGGVVDVIDKDNHYFKVTIDPEFEEEAAVVIEEIINTYHLKKEEAFKNNPLLRAKDLRDEIYGKGD